MKHVLSFYLQHKMLKCTMEGRSSKIFELFYHQIIAEVCDSYPTNRALSLFFQFEYDFSNRSFKIIKIESNTIFLIDNTYISQPYLSYLDLSKKEKGGNKGQCFYLETSDSLKNYQI